MSDLIEDFDNGEGKFFKVQFTPSALRITPDRYTAAFQPLPGAPAPVSLIDLPKGGCKWPVAEQPTLFCGCASDTGRYCPRHERMSGIRLEPLV